MNAKSAVLSILLSGCVLVASDCTPILPELQAMLAAYDQQAFTIGGGNNLGYTHDQNGALKDNDDAILGNSQGHVMSSLLTMYRATGRQKYLETLITQADFVLAVRDDALGLVGFDGRPAETNFGWGNSWYNASSSDPRRYPYLVESGYLTYPMADFAQLVLREYPVLQTVMHESGRSFLQVALEYRQRVAETLSFHDERRHIQAAPYSSPYNGQTYDYELQWFSYRPGAEFAQAFPGKPVPLNFITSIGRTYIMMYLAYLDDDPVEANRYKRTAEGLAYYTLVEMEYRSGWFQWTYWPRMDYYPVGYVNNGGNGSYEDLSHSTLTFEFAVLARDHIGIWFDTDVERLAKTFRVPLNGQGPGAYSMRVDGGGAASASHVRQLGQLLVLLGEEPGYESTLYDRVYNTLINDHGFLTSVGGAAGLESLSKLIRYFGF